MKSIVWFLVGTLVAWVGIFTLGGILSYYDVPGPPVIQPQYESQQMDAIVDVGPRGINIRIPGFNLVQGRD